MALKLNERYPGRFDNPSAGYPQGSFKNRTSPAAKDGSYLERDWANDKEGFFQSLIDGAGIDPNGDVDEVGASQYFDALLRVTNAAPILADTGAANAYAAINSPPLTALPATGYGQRIKIANVNTGASTYAPDGLAAKPIYGLGLQPLQGGELPAGVAILMYLVQDGVNSGNGAWIIIESLGGASQVAPATKSQHALQLGQLSLAGHGQCRLSVGSPTTLILKPYNGNNVIVNGAPLQLPSAGVTYTSSGLASSTLYYVYLGGTTAAPTLSLSTTGHSTASNGIETKTGDTTLTLVGMIYTNASTQFVDSLTSRTCLNWFNRRNLPAAVFGVGAFNFTSATAVEASSTLRVLFLNWAEEGVDISLSGDMSTNGGSILSLQLYLDGVLVGPAQQSSLQGSAHYAAYSSRNTGFYSEGLHTASPYVAVTLGSVTGALQHIQTNAIIRG